MIGLGCPRPLVNSTSTPNLAFHVSFFPPNQARALSRRSFNRNSNAKYHVSSNALSTASKPSKSSDRRRSNSGLTRDDMRRLNSTTVVSCVSLWKRAQSSLSAARKSSASISSRHARTSSASNLPTVAAPSNCRIGLDCKLKSPTSPGAPLPRLRSGRHFARVWRRVGANLYAVPGGLEFFFLHYPPLKRRAILYVVPR